MCGIWALVGQLLGDDALAACLAQLAARGPDMTRSAVVGGTVQLGFTRLAIKCVRALAAGGAAGQGARGGGRSGALASHFTVVQRPVPSPSHP
jgi:hypothetical protein